MLFPSWPSSCCPSFLEGRGWRGYNPNLPQCQMKYPRNATERGLVVLAWLMGFWSQFYLFFMSELCGPAAPHMEWTQGWALCPSHPNTSHELWGRSPPRLVHEAVWGRQRLVGDEREEMAPSVLYLHLVPPFHSLHKVGSRRKGVSFFLSCLSQLCSHVWCRFLGMSLR